MHAGKGQGTPYQITLCIGL